MMIESGYLIPVKNDAVDIPWTIRTTHIINCLHKGPVSFKTFVYNTNGGDISPVSTYFNPNIWTEYDLNFKFGITMKEISLNINSAGNSYASSTAESMFSSTSSIKKLIKDGCEEQTMFGTNSLQHRIVLISEDNMMSSGNSKNSCTELKTRNIKSEVKYADAQVVLNEGSQSTVTQNLISNKSESQQNTKTYISNSVSGSSTDKTQNVDHNPTGFIKDVANLEAILAILAPKNSLHGFDDTRKASNENQNEKRSRSINEMDKEKSFIKS